MTLYLTDSDASRGDRPRSGERIRARREALSGGRDHSFRCRRHGYPQDLRGARSAWRSSACRCWCTANRRARMWMYSTAKRCFIDEVLAAAARALRRSQSRVRAHHHGTRGGIRLQAHAPASPRPSRLSTCCTIATRFSRAASGRITTACRSSNASATGRRCSRPRPAATRASSSAPTARRTSGRPRRRLRLRRDVHRARRASSCTPRRSSRPAASIASRPFASHFGADFYGLPRHGDTHHLDQGVLGAPSVLRFRRRHAWCLIAAGNPSPGASRFGTDLTQLRAHHVRHALSRLSAGGDRRRDRRLQFRRPTRCSRSPPCSSRCAATAR